MLIVHFTLKDAVGRDMLPSVTSVYPNAGANDINAPWIRQVIEDQRRRWRSWPLSSPHKEGPAVTFAARIAVVQDEVFHESDGRIYTY